MALVVENGTGLATAESFVSVADADTYHSARGNSAWADGTTAEKEEALRRASTFLSNSYPWAGYPVNARTQLLAWPRYDVVDQDGNPVASDEVPREVVNATYEVALRELATPGSMNPDVTLADKVKREKVGPLEVEYANADVSANASRPILTIVRDMIGGLLRAGAASGMFGVAVRG